MDPHSSASIADLSQDQSRPPRQPSFLRRLSLLILSWIVIAAIGVASIPNIRGEYGEDPTEEKVRLALMAPITAALGLAHLVDGPYPSPAASYPMMGLLAALSLAILIGYPRTFRLLFAVHLLVLIVAFGGFHAFIVYTNTHGHG